MNKEIIKEVFGEDFDVDLTSMNTEAMREVAATKSLVTSSGSYDSDQTEQGTLDNVTVYFNSSSGVTLTPTFTASAGTSDTSPLAIGGTFNYVLTLKNNSLAQEGSDLYTDQTATSVVASFTLPDHMAVNTSLITGATGAKDGSVATKLNLTVPNIVPGATATITIPVTITLAQTSVIS